jgi:hypothetical protein
MAPHLAQEAEKAARKQFLAKEKARLISWRAILFLSEKFLRGSSSILCHCA